MNMSTYKKCLNDAGYALTIDGSIYRLDGKCIVEDVKVTLPDGHIIVINAKMCNEYTLRYSNVNSGSQTTNNQQGDNIGGKKKLTPDQCVKAWYIALGTMNTCGGTYTAVEKKELLKTILRDHGYDPDAELGKMDKDTVENAVNNLATMDVEVNRYLGTAAAIGRFLGKFGAYIIIGGIWVFKVLVSGLVLLGRCIVETALCAGKETQRILNERNK